MSGGVDSSVAARLLLEQGHEVLGIYMRHSFHKNGSDATDENDAREIARKLGIRFEVFDADPFFGEIIERFVDEYLAGFTPNPCVFCNRIIKFGRLFEFSESLGAEKFASGHYARIERNSEGDFFIRKGIDPGKDQSYVLFGIKKELLSKLEFPLGNYMKSEIRELAVPLGFGLAEKKESQEICFVPDHKHPEFIRAHRPDCETNGNFVSPDGTVLGTHDGYERFTIGQRKGMKVGFGKRVYVVKIDPFSRDVVIGDLEDLQKTSLSGNGANWHFPLEFGKPFRCEVKIRYRTEAKPATVIAFEDGRMEVDFDEPRGAIAPGQYAVCYDGEILLGGAKIEES